MNESAISLINAIQKFINDSNKNDYEFTIEEQSKIEHAMIILEKHIDFLVAYELKKEKDN